MREPLDIKAIREGLGMTQAEFAAAIGTDQGTVSKWEGRKHSPGTLARKAIQRLVEEARQAA
jgi:DNA-binding transcriptional regulator YiaG